MDVAVPSVRSPAVGDVLDGKYRVEHVLGAGGMGVVVAAQHLRLDQRVAIKFLRQEALQQPELVDRFLREARAAAKVRSEHVARVLDVGEFDSGAPYMVLEYLEGEDLAQALERNGRLPVACAIDYTLQLCEALAEAHVAGIVHRDLKPSNLFLARQVNGAVSVKLLDFGISKAPTPLESAERAVGALAMLGTPHYMSPEQVRAASDLDARSDIWALGVLLFECLSGVPPFDGATHPAVIAAILSQEPRRLSQLRADVPAELEAVVLRCLEKDRERRFPDTLRLVRALAPFAPGPAARSLPHVASVVGGSLETERPPPGDTHQGVTLSALVDGVEGQLAAEIRNSVARVRRSQTAPQVIPSLTALSLLAAGLFWFAHSWMPVSTDTTTPAPAAAAAAAVPAAPAPEAASHRDAPVSARTSPATPAASVAPATESPKAQGTAPNDAAARPQQQQQRAQPRRSVREKNKSNRRAP